MANEPKIMHLDVGDPLPEECLKRVPPALVHCLVEIVGPCEYPRPATPGIEFLDFSEEETVPDRDTGGARGAGADPWRLPTGRG